MLINTGFGEKICSYSFVMLENAKNKIAENAPEGYTSRVVFGVVFSCPSLRCALP
jgi:hypothetical protein